VSDLKFVKGEEITATKLNRTVDRLPGAGPPARPNRQFCAMFYTPEEGIPERDGDEVGAANCQRVILNGLTLATAESQQEQVVNLSNTPVGGSRYIQCLWIEGTWFANWEDCEYLEGSSSE
jgi:hypothetical protein